MHVPSTLYAPRTAMTADELVASFRSRGSYAHSARGTPAPTYPRGTSEKCVAPVCGSGDGHRRGYSMLCLDAPGAMTSCAAYEVQLLNPCSLTITTGWRDFQNSQPVLSLRRPNTYANTCPLCWSSACHRHRGCAFLPTKLPMSSRSELRPRRTSRSSARQISTATCSG